MRSIVMLALILSAFLAMTAAPSIAADPPEKVYETYMQGFKEGNFKKVLSCMSKTMNDYLKDTSDKDAAAALSGAKDYMPTGVKVTGKKISGNQATLMMEGTQKHPKTGETRKLYGKINFVNENGEWKVDRETWGPQPVK